MAVHSTSLKGLLSVSILLAAGSSLSAQDKTIRFDEQLYQFEPQTPAQLVRATVVATQLDRIRLARQYLQTLVESPLSVEQRVALRKDPGIGPLLMLSANRDLAPYAGQLLDQVNAASKESRLPESAAGDLIAQLDSDQRRAAVEAAADLVAMGDLAVPALLAADARTDSGRIAGQLLHRYRHSRRNGLFNALADSDTDQQVRILRLLRGAADRDLAGLLLQYEFGPYPTSVRQAASTTIHGLWQDSTRPDSGDQAAHWLAHNAAIRLGESADPFSGKDSAMSLNAAVRLGNAAFAVNPHADSVQSIHNAVLVAANQADANALDDFERDAALQAALSAEHGPAVLALMNDNPARLFDAMTLPDPVVRVSAATRMLRLNRPVRGCALAKEILDVAASGSLRPEAVVIDARDDLGQTAFLLRDPEGSFGYEVEPTSTGQSGFDAAVAQLQCEVIVVHANCLRWSLTPTIANLRNDFRTRNVPIVVYGADRTAGNVASLQSRYRGVLFLEEPLSPLSFADDMNYVGCPPPRLSEETRRAVIEAAREALETHESDRASVDSIDEVISSDADAGALR